MNEISRKQFNTKELTISAMVMALYIVLMALTASFSFGAIQLRIATALYALAYLFPFLILPLGLANALSNFMFGSLGIIDVLGGFVVGIMTSLLVYWIKKYRLPKWLLALPIIVVPGLGIPTYLHYLLEVPYWPLAINLVLGQIAPSILGVLLIISVNKRKVRLNG